MLFFFPQLILKPNPNWWHWSCIRPEEVSEIKIKQEKIKCKLHGTGVLWYKLSACISFFKINFYWSIVDLQHYVSFHCSPEWINYTYTYVSCFV